MPAKTEVLLVERASVSKPLRHMTKVIEVPSGSPVKLPAAFLGREAGYVFVKINDVVLPTHVSEWQPSHVVVDLPELGVQNPILAQVQIVNANGDLKKTIDISLLPAEEDVVVLPKSSAPTGDVPPAAAFNLR